jgi:hypothetical protein
MKKNDGTNRTTGATKCFTYVNTNTLNPGFAGFSHFTLKKNVLWFLKNLIIR